MAGLMIVSGTYGKGPASYDRETFTFPGERTQTVDMVASIEIHGGVAASSGDGWASDVVRSLKSGLSLASHLELTGVAALAAGALTNGLSVLDNAGPDAPRALIDIAFTNGDTFVALAHPALAALLLHDRDVVTRTVERLRATLQLETALSARQATILEDASATGSLLADRASSALTSAFDFIRRERKV